MLRGVPSPFGFKSQWGSNPDPNHQSTTFGLEWWFGSFEPLVLVEGKWGVPPQNATKPPIRLQTTKSREAEMIGVH